MNEDRQSARTEKLKEYQKRYQEIYRQKRREQLNEYNRVYNALHQRKERDKDRPCITIQMHGYRYILLEAGLSRKQAIKHPYPAYMGVDGFVLSRVEKIE